MPPIVSARAGSSIAEASGEICKPGGDPGVFFPLGGDWEANLPDAAKIVIYFIALVWCFLGVAIIAEVFMVAIEAITAKKRRVYDKTAKRFRTVKVWNDTVANLTLMALGSSAPEILLSVIELFQKEFHSGPLGPGTIVGSAAFNLLGITAVCVAAIESPEIRMIKDMPVFIVTASFSVMAYAWLIVILMIITPDKVDFIEALLTFLFFGVLISLAFAADKGLFGGGPAVATARGIAAAEMSNDEIAGMIADIKCEFGDIDEETVQLVIEKRTASRPSRAMYRAEANNMMTSRKKTKFSAFSASASQQAFKLCTHHELDFPQKIVEESKRSSDAGTSERRSSTSDDGRAIVEFGTLCHLVKEDVGEMAVGVKRTGDLSRPVNVRYRTEEASAKAGSDFIHTEGLLTFDPYEATKDIKIQILDDEEWEGHEEFNVVLYDVHNAHNDPSVLPAALGVACKTNVVIIDDDDPGVIAFEKEFIEIEGSSEDCDLNVRVVRRHGSRGPISCKYFTEDGTAVAKLDYEKLDSVLELADQEAQFDIPVFVKARGRYESTEVFRIVLSDPTGGARFGENTDGGKECDICTVSIKASQDTKDSVDRLVRAMGLNWDKAQLGSADWKAQFTEAIFVGGSLEDQREAGVIDWIFHLISVFWKLLFALVPPASIADGWACFFIALGMIGLVTAAVGDLAALLGCSIGMDPQVTAITFVALGTSLPDTFASKTAAQQDPFADASIGNITGSNSVNVFLGLGMPWTIGAIYWWVLGPTDAWEARYPVQSDMYPDGGFIVPAGGLGFSVAIFTACAVSCIACLAVRRRLFGGELGGPFVPKVATAVYLVSLWFVYVGASWMIVELNKD